MRHDRHTPVTRPLSGDTGRLRVDESTCTHSPGNPYRHRGDDSVLGLLQGLERFGDGTFRRPRLGTGFCGAQVDSDRERPRLSEQVGGVHSCDRPELRGLPCWRSAPARTHGRGPSGLFARTALQPASSHLTTAPLVASRDPAKPRSSVQSVDHARAPTFPKHATVFGFGASREPHRSREEDNRPIWRSGRPQRR